MDIAEKVSTRATCDRLRVGCVLVKDNRMIASGYNGSISGEPHCDDAGHLMIEGHCKRTIHAELNALLECARLGHACNEAACYVTFHPCIDCFKSLLQAGVKEIYYREIYRPEDLGVDLMHDIAERQGVVLEQV